MQVINRGKRDGSVLVYQLNWSINNLVVTRVTSKRNRTGCHFPVYLQEFCPGKKIWSFQFVTLR